MRAVCQADAPRTTRNLACFLVVRGEGCARVSERGTYHVRRWEPGRRRSGWRLLSAHAVLIRTQHAVVVAVKAIELARGPHPLTARDDVVAVDVPAREEDLVGLGTGLRSVHRRAPDASRRRAVRRPTARRRDSSRGWQTSDRRRSTLRGSPCCCGRGPARGSGDPTRGSGPAWRRRSARHPTTRRRDSSRGRKTSDRRRSTLRGSPCCCCRGPARGSAGPMPGWAFGALALLALSLSLSLSLVVPVCLRMRRWLTAVRACQHRSRHENVTAHSAACIQMNCRRITVLPVELGATRLSPTYASRMPRMARCNQRT